MNTYRLRCGEVVPLGMECALPPLTRETATRQWVRTLGFAALGFLPGLVAFNPAIQDLFVDLLLPDVPVIEVSTAAPGMPQNSLTCRP